MRQYILSLFVSAPFGLYAQPALNTTCATAVDLPVSSTNVQTEFLYIDNQNFPAAVPDPITDCSGSNSQRIGWFTFTAISSTHWLRTEGANVYGHDLEVLSGTCGSLTSIQCIPSGNPYQGLAGLAVGTVYYVRVIAPFFCTPADGNCQLGLAVVSAPTNNECSGAMQLNVLSSALTVNPLRRSPPSVARSRRRNALAPQVPPMMIAGSASPLRKPLTISHTVCCTPAYR
jgi:hypothetical protein